MTKLTRTVVTALTAATLGAGLLTASPALAIPQLQFSAVMGGCISGKVPQDFSTVDVVWRDKAGHQKASFSSDTGEYGYWYAPQPMCETHSVVKGDTIQASVTQPSDMTRTFTVKSVTGTFDRISNIIAGTAPASGMLYLDVGRPDLANNDFEDVCEPLVPVNSHGHYSYNTDNCAPGFEAIGGDEAFAEWINSNGDRVDREMHAPYVEALLGTAKVDGYLNPAGSTSLTLKSQGGAMRGSAHAVADAFGQFKTTVRKSGQSVTLKPNNVISGMWAGAIEYKVRVLKLGYTVGLYTVEGACSPNTAFGLRVNWPGEYAYLNGTTDDRGVAGPLDLTSYNHFVSTGDAITFVCMRPNGDRTKLVEVVPD